MEHFTPYLDIPQVKQLADQVVIDYDNVAAEDVYIKLL
jgi:hypothetical protein